MRKLFFNNRAIYQIALLLSTLTVLFATLGCLKKSKSYFRLKTRTENFSQLKNLTKSIDYSKDISVLSIHDSVFVYFTDKNKKLIKYSLTENRIDTVPLKVDCMEEDMTIMVIDQIVYLRCGTLMHILDLKTQMSKKINSCPFENCYFIPCMHDRSISATFDHSFIYQVGNSNNFNYIDSFIFLKYEDAGKFNKIVKYPDYFSKKYVHYLSFIRTVEDSFLYYLNVLDNKIYKLNHCSNEPIGISEIFGKDIVDYDTSRLTDMMYLKNYSEQVPFNIRLIKLEKYLVLLRLLPHKNNSEYRLLIFNNDLKLLSNTRINHPVNSRLIYSLHNNLTFLDPPNNLAYEYLFED